jgi:tripartite-type tricarboxylate transporter receptor subunit TctC
MQVSGPQGDASCCIFVSLVRPWSNLYWAPTVTVAALEGPDVLWRLENLGVVIAASTPEALAAYRAADAAKWGAVIHAANIHIG